MGSNPSFSAIYYEMHTAMLPCRGIVFLSADGDGGDVVSKLPFGAVLFALSLSLLFFPASAASMNTDGLSEPLEVSISQGIARLGFLWPLFVQGRVTSHFGRRTHPITGDADYHTGVDIHVPSGTAIRASQAGTVLFSGSRGGYGNTVIIKHGNAASSLYAHCERLLVKRGQNVYQGQVIATVGETGRATGPHLHFEIRIDNGNVNPLAFWKNHSEFSGF